MPEIPSSQLSRSQAFILDLNSRLASREFSKRSSRGVVFTIGGQVAKSLLRFGSTSILARLILPEEYGVVAMALLIVGFAEMFKDSGLSYASIQRKEISHRQISNLFWVNVALSFAIGLLLFLLAPVVAWVFGQPRVEGITRMLSVCFLLSGFSVQHLALLRRQMAFGKVVLIEVLALLVGISVAIYLAKQGYGYWALVGMQIGAASGSLLFTWGLVPWVPSRPSRGVGTKSFISFGMDILSFNFVNYFARRADDFLIGLLIGPGAMGFYEKAYTLLKLPISQINGALNGVAVPALSRLADDEDGWRKYFLGCYEVVASASIPIVTFVAVFSTDLVLVWLGDQWMRSSEIFRWLAPAALLGALSNPIGWAMVSKGRTKRYRNLGLINSAVVVFAFFVGVQFSEVAVAKAYSVACAVMLAPSWAVAFRGTGIRIADVCRVIFTPLLCSVASSLIAFWVLKTFLDGGNPVPRFLVAGATFGGCYSIFLLLAFGRLARLKTAIVSLKG